MAETESEMRIVSLRDGGFMVFKGYTSDHAFNPPAKACTHLDEALDYISACMTENTVHLPNLADANTK